jgi:hypothetical protein
MRGLARRTEGYIALFSCTTFYQDFSIATGSHGSVHSTGKVANADISPFCKDLSDRTPVYSTRARELLCRWPKRPIS